MNAVVIIVAGAGVLGAGAYLRWAITPVLIAYRLGKHAALLARVNRKDG